MQKDGKVSGQSLQPNLKKLPGSPGCFICDNDNSNPRALRLALGWDEATQTVHIPIRPDEGWCGYAKVVHGGLIAAVLDEGMAWAVKQKSGDWAFTVDFHLRYKKPVEPGRDYTVLAEAGDLGGRKIEAQARLVDENGGLVAQAEAVFLPGGGQAKTRNA
jgi:acyl-coenzyme A thioesterase PaaI-like protein